MHNVFYLLDQALGLFHDRSYNTCVFKAAAMALQAATVSAASSTAAKAIGGVEALSLGDNLEIYLAPDWVVGTIVRSNAVTGDLYVEHRRQHAADQHHIPIATSSTSTMVSILHKSNRRLRPIAAHPLPSPSTVTIARGDVGAGGLDSNTGGIDSLQYVGSPAAENDAEEVDAMLGSLVSLVFGSAEEEEEEDDDQEEVGGEENQEEIDGNEFSFSLGAEENVSGAFPMQHGQQRRQFMHDKLIPKYPPSRTTIPVCESGHACAVTPIGPGDAGFMCAYCAKIYDAGTKLLQQQPQQQSRYAQAVQKWTCEQCSYDVCTACFPLAGQHPLHHRHRSSLRPSSSTACAPRPAPSCSARCRTTGSASPRTPIWVSTPPGISATTAGR